MSHTKDHAMRVMLVVATAFTAVIYDRANSAEAQEIKIVVPNEFEDREGNLQQGEGTGSASLRSQELTLASEFDQLPPSYRWITAVALRPDESAFLPRHTEYGDTQYRLSTTDKEQDELSLVFAENVGPDETIVFDRRPYTISVDDASNVGKPGPREFDYVFRFDTPFYYDPNQGNLLSEFRSESGYLDAWPNADAQNESKSVAAILGTDADADEGTQVVNFSFVREYTFAALPGPTLLRAGDADQDLDFDQLDLVQVQIAAKYLTGQAATWGEGDWDGAPGACPVDPPAGDGLFDQRDVITALGAGAYLTGPYAAVQSNGQVSDGQTSVIYNARTGEVAVDPPAGDRADLDQHRFGCRHLHR